MVFLLELWKRPISETGSTLPFGSSGKAGAVIKKKTPRGGGAGVSVLLFGETFAGGRGLANLIRTKRG